MSENTGPDGEPEGGFSVAEELAEGKLLVAGLQASSAAHRSGVSLGLVWLPELPQNSIFF